jgi:hypothetical protein
MNPLVNTELQAYLKELIDQHIPGKGGEDEVCAGKEKPLSDQVDSTRPWKAKRGKNQ